MATKQEMIDAIQRADGVDVSSKRLSYIIGYYDAGVQSGRIHTDYNPDQPRAENGRFGEASAKANDLSKKANALRWEKHGPQAVKS